MLIRDVVVPQLEARHPALTAVGQRPGLQREPAPMCPQGGASPALPSPDPATETSHVTHMKVTLTHSSEGRVPGLSWGTTMSLISNLLLSFCSSFEIQESLNVLHSITDV